MVLTPKSLGLYELGIISHINAPIYRGRYHHATTNAVLQYPNSKRPLTSLLEVENKC